MLGSEGVTIFYGRYIFERVAVIVEKVKISPNGLYQDCFHITVTSYLCC